MCEMLLTDRFTMTWSFVMIYLVTLQVLEPYSKADTTLPLSMRTLRLFGSELFLQIGDNIPKASLVFLTLHPHQRRCHHPCIFHSLYTKTGSPLQLGVHLVY